MSFFRRQQVRKAPTPGRTLRKQLRMESLEQKNLLASDFAVSVVDGDLIIENVNQVGEPLTGITPDVINISNGSASDEFVLTSTEPIIFTDSMGGVTTVQPTDPPLTVDGVTRDVLVDLGDFSPPPLVLEPQVTLSVTSADLPRDLLVNGANLTSGNKDGGNGLLLDDGSTVGRDVAFNIDEDIDGAGFANIRVQGGTHIFGDLSVDTTASSTVDRIVMNNFTVDGDVSLDLGRSTSPLVGFSANSVTIGAATVGDDLVIKTEIGDKEVLIGSGTTVGDDLNLSLGNGNNTVSIDSTTVGDDLWIRTDAGDLLVSGDDVVTIVSTTIGDDLGVRTGAGGDEVSLGGFDSGELVSVGDDLNLRTGDDSDTLSLVQVDVLDDLKVSLGNGDDEAQVEVVNVTDNSLFTLGNGDDVLVVQEMDAGDTLTVTGRGLNEIVLEEVEANYFVNVITANGDDVIALVDVVTYSALIYSGGGDDEVLLEDSEFEKLIVLLGSGDDTLIIEGDVVVNRFAIFSGGSGEDTLDTSQGTLDANFLLDFAFEIYEDDMMA